jgi:hypothetical protein
MKKFYLTLFIISLFTNYSISQNVGDFVSLQAAIKTTANSLALTSNNLSDEDKTKFTDYLHSFFYTE